MYEKATALNDERKGTFASPHVNLSAYYNRTDNPDKALAHARRAIALDPKSDRAWFQRGRADERQGRLDDAVGALNKRDCPQPARIVVLLRARAACTVASGGRTRARRRSSCSSASSARPTSSTSSGAPLPRRLPRRWIARVSRRAAPRHLPPWVPAAAGKLRGGGVAAVAGIRAAVAGQAGAALLSGAASCSPTSRKPPACRMR